MRASSLVCTLGLAMAILMTSGCRRESKPEVAFVLKTLSNPYYVEMRKGILAAAAKESSIRVTISATRAETDVVDQNRLIEDSITAGAAVLCLTPDDSKGSIQGVLAANQAGRPVIVIDTKLDAEEMARRGAKTASFIASDNVTGGRLAAQALARAISERGEVVELEGAPGQETANSRSEGFRAGISQYPGISVVASQTAYWEREKGFEIMQSLLVAHPRLVGAFAANDEMALGALRAAESAKRQVEIVGFDYTPDAKAAIEAGRLYGSVAQRPAEMGRLAVEAAAALVAGKSVQELQPVSVEFKGNAH